MSKHRYISRQERRGASGWKVGFSAGKCPAKKKEFPDVHHGGKAAALAAALKWRDWWSPRLGKSLVTKSSPPKKAATKRTKLPRQLPHDVQINNTTGVVGVNVICLERRVNPEPYYAYVANWCQDVDGERKIRNKTFQFDVKDEHSRKTVLTKAKKHRKAMVEKHYGRN